MLRTLAFLMLLTPAAVTAQEPRDIEPGETLAGALGPADPTQYGRAYDDYRYAAVPGTRARVVVRSDGIAADVNVYFYDDYYDFIPLIAGGSTAKDTVDFTVPEVDSPTLVVFRVTTLAQDPGPSTGAYTIELSEIEEPGASSTELSALEEPRAPPGR